MARIIEVVEYNPLWPEMFLEAKQQLKSLLEGQVILIEHIGSTSVPGLCAKPIIDILVEVKNLDFLDNLTAQFTALGFVGKGENGIVGRRYFQKGGLQRTHHVHIFEQGHDHAFEHRIFRDYLKAHKLAALQYAEIKMDAARACNNDIRVYMTLKDEFIKAQLQQAKNWYKDTIKEPLL